MANQRVPLQRVEMSLSSTILQDAHDSLCKAPVVTPDLTPETTEGGLEKRRLIATSTDDGVDDFFGRPCTLRWIGTVCMPDCHDSLHSR